MSQKNEFHNLDDPSDGLFRDLAPGLTTRIFAGEQAMLSVVTLTPHAEGTLHHHPEEQWGVLLEGSALRMQGGEEIAVKKGESDVLRGEASNAKDGAPKVVTRRKRVRFPKREKVYLAVHRHDNMLYYKRLDPEAFAILTLLRRGITVEDACLEAVTASKRTNVDWSTQIKEWFDAWSALGWFCRKS